MFTKKHLFMGPKGAVIARYGIDSLGVPAVLEQEKEAEGANSGIS